MAQRMTPYYKGDTFSKDFSLIFYPVYYFYNNKEENII